MTQRKPSALGQWLLERHAEGLLPSIVSAQVQKRLHTDVSWKRWYHLLRQAERGVGAANANAPPLSGNQMAQLRQSILAATAVAPAQARPAREGNVPFVASLAAAACAVAFVLLPSSPSAPGQVESTGYTERGHSGDSGLRLRARCVNGGAVDADVEARQTPVELRCVAGQMVAVSVTNTRAEAIRVVLEVERAGERSRPLPSQVVAGGAVNVLFKDGLRLDGLGTRVLQLVDDKTNAPVSPPIRVTAP